MTKTPGNDVSRWQGVIDFEKFARKSKFVYVRGMFGGYNSPAACKDANYDINMDGFASVGVPAGAYCFGNYMTYPDRQAAWFEECAAGKWGELPPMLDFEWFWKPYPSPLKCLSWIKEFFEQCDEHSGKETIFYCNPGMIKYLSPLPAWLIRRTLSVAHYTTAAQPSVYGFNEWTFWQYSDRGQGKEYGVQSAAIDLQWFNGSEVELQKFIYGTVPEPEPADPDIGTPGDHQAIEILDAKVGVLSNELGSLKELMSTWVGN